MKKNTKKRNTSIGCLFWIALILLVLIVFLFNRERIRTVIEETGFDEFITQQETPSESPEVKRTAPEEEEKPKTTESEGTGAEEQPDQRDEQQEPAPQEEQAESEEQRDSEAEPQDEIRVEEERETSQEESERSEEPRIDKKMRKSELYFVSVADEGAISLRRIVRPVYYESSPLTQTLTALMEGLTSSELNAGLLNLIPDETELLGVRVEEGIAYIDFSEELKFNPFGTEGLKASLRQIVYTATEFNTVEKVQLLIEGRTHSSLSTEGIFIGEPLGRDDL